MPLQLRDDTAVLTGTVRVEDVEELAGWLKATTDPRVDLSDCNHLHTAAFQALTAFRPKVIAAPVDAFLRERLLPVLTDRPQTEGAENDDGNAG